MSKHTPEPWKHVGQGDIIGADNDDVCAAYLRTDIGDANARRIVACVNACAGIPTSRIEAGAADILAYSMELKKQRDELLDLIDAAARTLDRDGDEWGLAADFRAAIASVKEK